MFSWLGFSKWLLEKNREKPNQTVLQKQSDLGLSYAVCRATSVRNFRTFTISLERGYFYLIFFFGIQTYVVGSLKRTGSLK